MISLVVACEGVLGLVLTIFAYYLTDEHTQGGPAIAIVRLAIVLAVALVDLCAVIFEVGNALGISSTAVWAALSGPLLIAAIIVGGLSALIDEQIATVVVPRVLLPVGVGTLLGVGLYVADVSYGMSTLIAGVSAAFLGLVVGFWVFIGAWHWAQELASNYERWHIATIMILCHGALLVGLCSAEGASSLEDGLVVGAVALVGGSLLQSRFVG